MQTPKTVSDYIIKELDPSNSLNIISYDDSEDERVQYGYERIHALRVKT